MSQPQQSLFEFLNSSNDSEFASRHVPQLWLDQSPPDPTVQKFLAVFFAVICVPSQICQLCVIFVFLRYKRMRTPSNKLLMSLTVADFIILTMCYCLLAQNVTPSESGSFFGVQGCKIYGSVSTIAALAEIWSLTLVSVDRFQAIFHPLETKKRMGSVKVHCYLLIVWVSSIAFGLSPLFGWNNFVSEAYLLGCSFDTYTTTWNSRSYILVLIVLAWMLPLAVIGSCYCQIFQSVKNNLFLLANGSTSSSELQRARKKHGARICLFIGCLLIPCLALPSAARIAIFQLLKKKLFLCCNEIELSLGKMVGIILAIWILAWTPYVVLAVWVMFFNGAYLTPQMAIFPTIFCKVSASSNALMYGIRLPRFKEEISKIANQTAKKLPWSSKTSLDHKTGMVKVDISSCGARAEKLSVHFLVQNSCAFVKTSKKERTKEEKADVTRVGSGRTKNPDVSADEETNELQVEPVCASTEAHPNIDVQPLNVPLHQKKEPLHN